MKCIFYLIISSLEPKKVSPESTLTNVNIFVSIVYIIFYRNLKNLINK